MIPALEPRLPNTVRSRLLDHAGRIAANDLARRRRFIRDADRRYGTGTGDALLIEVDRERERLTAQVDAQLARFGTSRDDLRRRAARALRRLETERRVRTLRLAAVRVRRCRARPRAQRAARRGSSRSRDPGDSSSDGPSEPPPRRCPGRKVAR